MTSQNVLKFKCNERDYYLMTTKTNDDLELVLTDVTKAWKGKVSIDDLSAKSKEVENADCAEQSRNALMGDSTESYEYELKGSIDSNESVQLIWKKVFENNTIKFQLGSTWLKPCDSPCTVVGQVFDHLLNDASVLRRSVRALELDRDRLAEERSTAIKKLGDCASLKEDTEHSLYAKFVAILNEKKAKIRSLKEQLELSHTSESATQPGVVKKSSVRNTSSVRRTSENMEVDRPSDRADTSEHDIHTDEEGDNKFPHAHVQVDCTTVTSSTKSAEEARRNRTVSAGSQSPLSFMLEDSANKSDDDELPVVAKRGKRADVEDQKQGKDASPQKSAEADKSGGKSKQKPQRIPCMLSTTGTTNTSTTSSDRQRQLDLTTTSGNKKETPKQTAQSSDIIDDMLNEMA